MTHPAIPTAERRERLIEMLRRDSRVRTEMAARRLGTSAMTIRRDLAALQASGALLRCHGGAMPAGRITFEFAFDERHQRNLAAKRRIGAVAAAGVEAGARVFLDTGTTTLEVARALVARQAECEVITSSLAIAGVLWGAERIGLVLAGGRVRRGSPDLAGAGTELLLERLSADVAFVGSEGVDGRRGSFAGDIEAARVAELMIAGARRAVVVADGSKIGHAAAVRYATVDDIDELVTDRAADGACLRRLRRAGVRVQAV
jgi:DeoR/GlpR family transcriptional regulator of sugar metabolism